MYVPNEHIQSFEVPISEWVDNSVQNNMLDSAGIVEAFRPLTVLMGLPPCIFVNNVYDLNILDKSSIIEISAQSIVDILRNVLIDQNAAETYLITALVSDGNSSHAISLEYILPTQPSRLFYMDPWGGNSFLERGKNIANIEAKSEGEGIYSIDFDEFERVLVACGFHRINEFEGLDFRLSLARLKSSSFYSSFNISEIGSEKRSEHTVLKLKTGGFQQFIDIAVLVDQNEKIHRATLTMARPWITQMGTTSPVVVDIVKSFIDAIIPKQIDLSQLGIVDDPVVFNPDRILAEFLVKAFWELPDQQKTERNFANNDKCSQIAFDFLLTFVGRADSADAKMLFSKLEAQNIMLGEREEFKLEVSTDFQWEVETFNSNRIQEILNSNL